MLSCIANISRPTGIVSDTFLTISDEDDFDPFVNVVIAIQEGCVTPPPPPSPPPAVDRLNQLIKKPNYSRHDSADSKPIRGIWPSDQGKIKIPTKPKKAAPLQPETNGHGHINGKRALNGAADNSMPAAKRPRQLSNNLEEVSEVTFSDPKKAKTEAPQSADVVIVEDDGAIVID